MRRKQQIIAAAIPLFAQKGFAATTMDDIATAVGVNKATLYLYYKSKDTLIQAIASDLFAQELADLQAAHDMPGTAVARLTAYYQTLIATETAVLPLMPVIYEFYALGLRRDDVRHIIATFISQAADLLETIIAEGVAAGEFAPTTPRQAARAFDALLSGTILHWVYAPEEVEVAAQLRYSLNLFFRGLLAAPGEG
jgi:TetR/AcrR family fatty acid metabolism transcriptional regulator